jgi:hypothetical protein
MQKKSTQKKYISENNAFQFLEREKKIEVHGSSFHDLPSEREARKSLSL